MKHETYTVKYPRRVILRKSMIGLGKLLLSLMAEVEISGRERLPKKGPIILAGNHVAVMEAVLMAVYSPGMVEFVGNGDIPFDPNYAFIANTYDLIPVNRGNIDRQGLKMGLDVLAQDGILGIFPEPYTGEALSAQDAAGPIITANPDITHWVVFGCNDEGVLGTTNALATAGFEPDSIIAVGLGAYEACKFWAAEQDSGFKAALFISGLDVGRTAAQVLYDAVVNGVVPPEQTFAPTTIVTPDNYQDVMDPISLNNCSQ